MNYEFSSYSYPGSALSPGIWNFSVAHAPKSINLQFFEQNGLNILPLERSAFLLQFGHLLRILESGNTKFKFNYFRLGIG